MPTTPSKDYRPLKGSERLAAPDVVLYPGRRPRRGFIGDRMRPAQKPEAPPLPSSEQFSAGVRPRLTQEEFAAIYGASEGDLALVETFAAAHGPDRRRKKSAARRTLILTGTVKQMNKAFAVELGQYETPTETYRGREGHVHLPAELIEIVTGVFGLDNRQVGKLNGDPPNTILLSPPQVAGLYNFPTRLRRRHDRCDPDARRRLSKPRYHKLLQQSRRELHRPHDHGRLIPSPEKLRPPFHGLCRLGNIDWASEPHQ